MASTGAMKAHTDPFSTNARKPDNTSVHALPAVLSLADENATLSRRYLATRKNEATAEIG